LRVADDLRPLRVLYLITDFAKGGAERFLIDLAMTLRRREDVEFVIGSLYEHDLYGALTDDLPIEQLDFQTFSPRGSNSCPAYERLLQRFRPDVVHTHRFLAEFLSSYYVSPDIAYVCHGHDNMVQLERPSWRTVANRGAFMNLIERWHLIRNKYNKVPTAFIANSNYTLDYFRRVLPRHTKSDVVLIPCGFNYDRFFNSEVQPPADNERLRLLNVGSFQPKKNQAFIVDVARELLHRGVDFEIHLLGDGATRPEVESSVKSAGLDERVLFHGNVHSVERWMCDSHIYLHTAWYEPFGLVLLEAMAAGLPCVTLDGKGNRDLIKDGHNGFLLERQDAAAFADRIVELATDRERYRAMSASAQAFAKNYDIDAATDQLVNFYRARIELARRVTMRGS
jgi:glycosyltransferase involved in cell wall biosynthesis